MIPHRMGLGHLLPHRVVLSMIVHERVPRQRARVYPARVGVPGTRCSGAVSVVDPIFFEMDIGLERLRCDGMRHSHQSRSPLAPARPGDLKQMRQSRLTEQSSKSTINTN